MNPGFVLCADTHFSDSKLAEHRWDLFRFLKQAIESHSVKQQLEGHKMSVVFAGDLVDKKDRHSADFVNRLVDAMRLLAMEGIRIYLLRGNHDYVTDTSCAFFRFLKDVHESIEYIDKPTVRKIGGLSCLLIPHDRKGITCDTLKRNGDPYDVIVCHQTFRGAKVHGRELPGCSVSRLSKEAVGTARVFSGDIHEPQRVGNVQYIGAPYHTAFGDTYQGRVLIVEDEGVTPVPYFTAPKKHNIHLFPKDINSDWMADVHEGDHVRVHLQLTPAEAMDVTALRKLVRKKLTDVTCCGVLVDVSAPTTKRSRLFGSSDSWDDRSVFHRYCSQEQVPQELITFAKDYYDL